MKFLSDFCQYVIFMQYLNLLSNEGVLLSAITHWYLSITHFNEDKNLNLTLPKPFINFSQLWLLKYNINNFSTK